MLEKGHCESNHTFSREVRNITESLLWVWNPCFIYLMSVPGHDYSVFSYRVRNLSFCRDRNHASIFMWSLGNEAGRGQNLWAARSQIMQLDLSRPIQYESGGAFFEGIGRTELTDVVCNMYPNVEKTIDLGTRQDEDRPVILCEYSHSMGNSNGNIHLYWEQFWDESKPRLQGGFIWDFVDQGLRQRTADGQEYFAYGGDFGDEINDKQFCINVSPKLIPFVAILITLLMFLFSGLKTKLFHS